MRIKDQHGVSIIDALFAMVIASMIAAAITTSLGTWFNVRNQTANQDAANQYAQGIIAKTASVDWAKLGFKQDQNSPALPQGSGFTEASCSTTYRATPKVGDKTFKTVTSDTAVAGINQTSVTQVRGKEYCVQTDVTWKSEPTGKVESNASGVKNVSVTVSWVDKGVTRNISVNSTRTPNIGEAIPSGLSEVKENEVSPIKTFSVTKATHDGTNGRICYTADWNDTTDTVSLVGSSGKSLLPVSFSEILVSADRTVEKCTDIPDDASYGYYGVEISDEAGRKFVSSAEYQFPGSKITRDGWDINWNAYHPATGSNTYKIYKASNAEFSDSTLLATTTDTTYKLGEVTADMWLRIDTENPSYSVTSQSNVLAVPVMGPEPTATPEPTPTAEPTPTTPTPTGPSIVTVSDIVAYDSAGALWNYGNGTISSTTRKMIEPEGATRPHEFFVTDWNSDGTQDLLVKQTDGKLIFRKGLTTGGFTDTQIGSGWGGFNIAVGKWKKTDTHPSIIGKENSTGTLWHYGNPSGQNLSPRVSVGNGWTSYHVSLLDWDKDGSMDIVARNSVNEMKLYRTNGAGAFISEARATIGTGWTFNHIRTIYGRGGAGTVGLVARDSNGALWYYQANKSVWASTRQSMGGGWTPYLIAGN